MATSYTSILRLAQPAQGELSGTWGTVVNNNITAMIEEAIAGSATIDTWVTNSATLSTANGTTDESRPAILLLTDTTSDLTGSGTLIVPTATKQYICKNDTGETITVKTAAGTGVAIANAATAIVFCDGTNVESAAGTLTDVVEDTTPQLGGNLDVNSNSIISASAGDIAITPDTTGDIILDGQKWPQADGTANQLIETDGAGQLSWTSAIDGVTIGNVTPAPATVTTFTSTGIDDNASSTAITIDSSDRVSIGTTDVPAAVLQNMVQDGLEIQSDTAGAASIYQYQYNDAGVADHSMFRANGTKSSPTTVGNGDAVGQWWGGAYDGTDWHPVADMRYVVDGVPSDGTDMPGGIRWRVTPDASATLSEAMRINNDGTVSIGQTDAETYLTQRNWGGLRIEHNTAYKASIYLEGYETSVGNAMELYHKKSRGTKASPTTVVDGDGIAYHSFSGQTGASTARQCALMAVEVDGTVTSGNCPGRISWYTTVSGGGTAATERMRIDDGGNVLIGTTVVNPATSNVKGINLSSQVGLGIFSRDGDVPVVANRKTDDGLVYAVWQDGTQKGGLQVDAVGVVSVQGAHLCRISQLPDSTTTDILRGTVITNLDEMCLRTDDKKNQQLNRTAVSSVEGDKNVAGVFQGWTNDNNTAFENDFDVAMTGDFIIRIHKDTVVERGDLLMSAGDGTAKPQEDDLVRSCTVAKVTSSNVTEVYEDGSYLVPCVLMAC